jgi:plasmid stabilization system protein ParE
VNWDVTLRPEAEAEIAEASDWYEQQNPGLHDKFISAVDVTLSALRQNPFQYQAVSEQLRRAKLRRFPYGLLYVVSDRQVTVVSCVHGRRDPKIWQERT